MTHRYVALLRGINVGGHRVEMRRLRALFEELGFRDVSTFIASGNVVFSTDSDDAEGLRTSIEGHLERELGYAVATFLRTPAELALTADAGKGDARDGEPGASHYVIFLHDPAQDSLRSELRALESDVDAFRCAGREIHWTMRGKLSESPLFGGAIERATRRVPTTMRNMTTLRRLAAKVGATREG